jgi:hypothetical protein
VITGYNTDIEFNGVVYHVQTEDKGPAVPMILSLVYDRGTILASKRAHYDLDAQEADENELAERLQRQHKLICAAVLAGRIDDLKRMSAVAREHKRSAEASPSSEPASKNRKGKKDGTVKAIDKGVDIPVKPVEEGTEDIAAPENFEAGPPIPMPVLPVQQLSALEETELTILDDVKVLEEYSLLSPEDLQIVSDLAGLARPEHDHLSVEFVGSPEFKAGKSTTVFIMVCRGSRREVIRGSEIMVKVLGSAFRPVIYHSVSDKNGLANVEIEIPPFNSGRATVLARAKNNGDEVEVRRPVLHG